METFLLLLLSPRDVLCPCRRFLLLFWGPTDAPPSFRPWACPYSAPQVLRMFLVHPGHPRDVHLRFWGSRRCSFSIFGSPRRPFSVLWVLQMLLLHFWGSYRWSFSILWVLGMALVRPGRPRDIASPFLDPRDGLSFFQFWSHSFSILGSSLGPRVIPSLFWGPGVIPSPFFGSWSHSFTVLWVLQVFLLCFGVLELFLLHSLDPRVVPSPFFGSWSRSFSILWVPQMFHPHVLDPRVVPCLFEVLESFLLHSLGPPGLPSPFFGSWSHFFFILWVLESFLLYFGVLESFFLHSLDPRVVPSPFFGS